MHKVLSKKRLRGLSTRRGGFSLAELVVAIGVLALMVSLAGQVLSLTVRSTGQARALTEVNQALRRFENTLREDLGDVKPDESLLLIHANPMYAFRTADERDADADGIPDRENLPRADVLMYFTARPASSVQQVVLGHAELGKYVIGSGDDCEHIPGIDCEFQRLAGPDQSIFLPDLNRPNLPNPRDIPFVLAADWHLARRSVLLLTEAHPSDPPPLGWINYNSEPTMGENRLNDPKLLRGEDDIVGGFKYEQHVLMPSNVTPGLWPWYWPKIFDQVGPTQWSEPFARSQLDTNPSPRLAKRLGHYFLPDCSSFKVEWGLDPRSDFVGGRLDDESVLLWFDPGAREFPQNPGEAPRSVPMKDLYLVHDEAEAQCDDCPRTNRLRQLLNAPLGGHRPPGPCDPNTSERYSLASRFALEPGPDGLCSKASTWHRHPYGDGMPDIDIRPNLVVFANRPAPLSDVVPDDVFPAALRITVELFDKARRLDKPTRHVMVIPVGG